MGNLLGKLFGSQKPTWVQGLGTYVEKIGTNCRMLLKAKAGENLSPHLDYNNITSKAVFRLGRSELRVKDLEQGRCFDLKKSLTVGRDSSNNIVFNDPTVSARHMSITQISQSPPRYLVRDLGSTNGTYALKI